MYTTDDRLIAQHHTQKLDGYLDEGQAQAHGSAAIAHAILDLAAQIGRIADQLDKQQR